MDEQTQILYMQERNKNAIALLTVLIVKELEKDKTC